MQTKLKLIIYANLKSLKLLYPLRYRERTFLCPKLLFVRQDNKTFGQAVFPDLKFFQLFEKPIKKGSTQNIIINPVRNGQTSDYSFGSFRRRVEVKVKNIIRNSYIPKYIEKIGENYSAKIITKILTKNDWITRYVFWVDLKTKTINLPIITWDKEIIGNSMKYTWIEQDNSDTQTEFYIGISSTFGNENSTQINSSVKVTIGDKDDEAGEDVVEYKDRTIGDGTEYNTGIVRFWVNQL